jgi:CBS-domain-containing membrane protein
MDSKFTILSHIPLQPGTRCQNTRSQSLDDPALDVMTDFTHVRPVATNAEILIDHALENMKTRSVRLLLVHGEDDSVTGLITATDILGEKPVQLIRETGVHRSELTVAMLMTPLSAIEVLSMTAVRNARIGHIVATLRELERRHLLVVEVDPERGEQVVRGLFSSSQIGKQLGMDVSEIMTAARSLAEIQHELVPHS